jgi:hypothetical protein
MGAESRFALKRLSASRAFFLLALLAVAVLLARPICDAYRSHPGTAEPAVAVADHTVGGESELCCEGLDEVAVISASTGSADFEDDSTAAAPFDAVPPWRPVYLAFSPPLPPDRPPISRPYYARSARILI